MYLAATSGNADGVVMRCLVASKGFVTTGTIMLINKRKNK